MSGGAYETEAPVSGERHSSGPDTGCNTEAIWYTFSNFCEDVRLHTHCQKLSCWREARERSNCVSQKLYVLDRVFFELELNEAV